MLHGTTCPDKIGISRHSGEKFDLRKYCLMIVSLVLVSIHIQAQNGWTQKQNMPTPRGTATASVINNKIYVIGGSTAGSISDLANNEVYSPSTNTWEIKESMTTVRGFLTSEVVNGIIYAIGGGYPVFKNKNEAYDPVTNSWSTKADMLGTRLCMRAGTVDGIIYTVGGNYNQRNCQAYDPSTNIWTEKTPVPEGGGVISATVYNDSIYVFGGGYYGASSVVWAYNPQTDTWTKKQDMPTPRFAFQTYLVGGKIYAMGGAQTEYGASLATVEVYDPVSDTWATSSNMPFALAWYSGAVVNDKIYVIGGTSNWGVTMSNSVWEYDPAYVVPVELVSFTGSIVNGKVLLEWKTATELNNYGFEIQRKALSGNFATIAFVKGQGTTTQKNDYSFADKNLEEGKYFYRLKQMDFGGKYEYSQIVEVDVRMLDKFSLEQNYPNPFNPSTTVGYVLQEKSNATLILLNTIGEEIAILVNEEQDKGYHKVEFDGSKLSSGVYFYQLTAGLSSSSGQVYIETKKMMLLR